MTVAGLASSSTPVKALRAHALHMVAAGVGAIGGDGADVAAGGAAARSPVKAASDALRAHALHVMAAGGAAAGGVGGAAGVILSGTAGVVGGVQAAGAVPQSQARAPVTVPRLKDWDMITCHKQVSSGGNHMR